MADDLDVNLAALDVIAGRLGQSAERLDSVGETAPGIPDAGDVSGIMGAAIAHLTESAGNLVLGMMGAGEQVAAARAAYAARDVESADSIRGY